MDFPAWFESYVSMIEESVGKKAARSIIFNKPVPERYDSTLKWDAGGNEMLDFSAPEDQEQASG